MTQQQSATIIFRIISKSFPHFESLCKLEKGKLSPEVLNPLAKYLRVLCNDILRSGNADEKSAALKYLDRLEEIKQTRYKKTGKPPLVIYYQGE